jgi:hypothetical protein
MTRNFDAAEAIAEANIERAHQACRLSTRAGWLRALRWSRREHMRKQAMLAHMGPHRPVRQLLGIEINQFWDDFWTGEAPPKETAK